MEFMNEIWMGLLDYICIPYLLVFMLLAYLVKRYFTKSLQRLTNTKWRTVYTVLIIATVTAIPFLLFTALKWETILMSYAVGTSLHELVFAWCEDKFERMT
jgi:Kef-type K+ transport system membrane component KefB